jgi:predicted RecA/RadA family phage recombinase
MPLVPFIVQRLRSGDVVQFGDVVAVFLDAAAFHELLPTLAGT